MEKSYNIQSYGIIASGPSSKTKELPDSSKDLKLRCSNLSEISCSLAFIASVEDLFFTNLFGMSEF
jgi:hypothetical protein